MTFGSNPERKPAPPEEASHLARESDYVRQQAHSLLSNKVDAEDLAQETLLDSNE